MQKSREINKGERIEIKELYDGSFTSIKELAGIFHTTIATMRWITDHKNFRQKQTFRSALWREKNPKKAKEIQKKASKTYWLKMKK